MSYGSDFVLPTQFEAAYNARWGGTPFRYFGGSVQKAYEADPDPVREHRRQSEHARALYRSVGRKFHTGPATRAHGGFGEARTDAGQELTRRLVTARAQQFADQAGLGAERVQDPHTFGDQAEDRAVDEQGQRINPLAQYQEAQKKIFQPPQSGQQGAVGQQQGATGPGGGTPPPPQRPSPQKIADAKAEFAKLAALLAETDDLYTKLRSVPSATQAQQDAASELRKGASAIRHAEASIANAADDTAVDAIVGAIPAQKQALEAAVAAAKPLLQGGAPPPPPPPPPVDLSAIKKRAETAVGRANAAVAAAEAAAAAHQGQTSHADAQGKVHLVHTAAAQARDAKTRCDAATKSEPAEAEAKKAEEAADAAEAAAKSIAKAGPPPTDLDALRKELVENAKKLSPFEGFTKAWKELSAAAGSDAKKKAQQHTLLEEAQRAKEAYTAAFLALRQDPADTEEKMRLLDTTLTAARDTIDELISKVVKMTQEMTKTPETPATAGRFKAALDKIAQHPKADFKAIGTALFEALNENVDPTPAEVSAAKDVLGQQAWRKAWDYAKNLFKGTPGSEKKRLFREEEEEEEEEDKPDEAAAKAKRQQAADEAKADYDKKLAAFDADKKARAADGSKKTRDQQRELGDATKALGDAAHEAYTVWLHKQAQVENPNAERPNKVNRGPQGSKTSKGSGEPDALKGKSDEDLKQMYVDAWPVAKGKGSRCAHPDKLGTKRLRAKVAAVLRAAAGEPRAKRARKA